MPRGRRSVSRASVDSTPATSVGPEELHHQGRLEAESRAMRITTRSTTRFCFYCKEDGHHIGNCIKAFEDQVAHAAIDCPRGIHFPYLHGCWRCKWCHEHLLESDVREANYDLWLRETANEASKQRRFMDVSHGS